MQILVHPHCFYITINKHYSLQTQHIPTMLKLLADSGSTKTDWLVIDQQACKHRLTTQGINPVLLNAENICDIIQQELLPILENTQCCMPYEITFYGAGCRGNNCKVVENALQKFWPSAHITVDSDLLGAARCTCNAQEAIVCILGTGSNSCHYDGEKIINNVPPLGFILGDEGSGASLGKRLVGDVIKQQLPEEIVRSFFNTYPLTTDDIIQKVYRTPLPNRFLAAFTHFLHQHRHRNEIRQLIQEEFQRFFTRNIAVYQRKDLPIHFVGSIAWHFSTELQATAQALGYRIGKIHKTPFDALLCSMK